MSVIQRLEIWKFFKFPRIGYNKNEILYKIDNISNDEISFYRTNMYTLPPVGFVTQFVWEYPDKQIGICNLDLKYYNIYRFDRLYQHAIRLPEGLQEGDLVYVDTKQLMRYELV